MPRRFQLRTVGAMALAAGLLSCTDGATAPRRNSARVALAPQFSVDASHIAARLSEFALTVNRVRVTLVRPPSEVLKDTLIDFPTTATQISVELEVNLKESEEQLLAGVQLRDNDVVLFEGQQTIVARRGQTTGGDGSSPVTLNYTGPGNGAVSLAIVQRQPAIATGGSIQLTTTVLDQAGQAVPGLPLRWTPGDSTRLTIDAAGIARSIALPGTVWAKVEGLNGLKDSVQVAITQQASRIAIVSGNGQPTVAGAPLGAPLVVRVMDALAQPMPNVAVSWHVGSAGGSLGVASSTSDQSGNAQNTYTAPTQSGAQPEIVAAIALDSVRFVLGTVAPAGASGLAILQQPAATQSAQVMAPSFIVQLQDQYGNGRAQAGIAVTATLAQGAGLTLGGTTTVATDVNGRASFADLTLTGNTGTATLAFNATGLVGATTAPITVGLGAPAQIQILAGDGQRDTVGRLLAQPLQVRVVDAGNNPIQAANIDWLISAGSASFSAAAQLTSTTTQTAGDGTTSVPLWLGQSAGEVLVQARVQNLALSTTFHDTAVAAAANHLILVQQPSATVQAGVVFPQQPRVQIVDAFGNPVGHSGMPIQIDLYTGGQLCGTAPTAPTAARSLSRTPTSPLLGAVAAPGAGNGSEVVLGYRPARHRGTETLRQPRPGLHARRGTMTVATPRLDSRSSVTRAQLNAAAAASRPRQAIAPPPRASRPAARLAPRLTRPATTPARTSIAPRSPALASTPTATDFCGYGGVRGTLTLATDATGAVQFTDVRLDIVAGTWGLTFSTTDTTIAAVTSEPIVVTAAAPAVLSGYFYGPAGGFADTLQVSPGDTIRGWVYVQDAYGSYVPDVPLSWTPTGGTLDSTSAATDASGYGYTIWVVPNVTGTFALVVRSSTLPNDSVKVVASSVPRTPSYFDPYSGAGQVGVPGQPLGAPFVARVLDQNLQPVPNVPVTWSVVGNTGTLSTVTGVSDASGLVSTTYTPTATMPGRTDEIRVTLDNLTTTATFYTSIPIATATRTWVARSTATDTSYYDWNDPANWEPAGVPTASDVVWIPRFPQHIDPSGLWWTLASPTMYADATIGQLQMEQGSDAWVGTSTLTVLGDARSNVVYGDSTGRVVVNAPGARVTGYFPNLTILQSAVVDTLSTSSRLLQVSEALDVHGPLDLTDASVYAVDSVVVADTGALRMPTGNSVVQTGGSMYFMGAASIDYMIGGYLEIGASLIQRSTVSPVSFAPSSALQTIFYGSGVVDFQDTTSSALGSVYFQSSPSDSLRFLQRTRITGDFYTTQGSIVRSDHPLAIYGRISTDGTGLPNVAQIDFWGTEFPSIYGPAPKLLRVLSDVVTTGSIQEYAGDVAIDTGGVVQVGDSLHFLRNLTVTGPGATLVMSTLSRVVVDSNVVFDGADASNALAGGVLTVRGDFTQGASITPYSFAAGAAHRTVFDGTGLQSVRFATSDTIAGSHFGRVWINNGGGGVQIIATSRNYPEVAALGDVEVFDPLNLKPAWLLVDALTTLRVQYPASPRFYHNAHFSLNGNIVYSQCYAVQDGSVLVDGANGGQFQVSRCTAIPNTATYNAATDFSTTANPNGPWVAGFTTTLGAVPTQYSAPANNPTIGYDYWASAAGGAMIFARKDAQPNGTYPWSGGQAALNPGCGNEYSVIRWIAPASGNYDVVARFYAGDVGETSGYVLRGGAALLSTATTSTQPEYTGTLSLGQGEAIDVVVGAGADGCNNDMTPIDFTVTTHTTPIGAPAPVAVRATRAGND